VVAQRAAEPGGSLYLLTDANGRRIAGNLAAIPSELAAGGQGKLFSYRPAVAPEVRARPRVAVGVAWTVPSGLILVVARDVEDVRRFAVTMGQLGLAAVVLLSALAIAAGIGIARLVLRRIDAVNEASRSIMAGDLKRRIPLDGSGDEFDRLAANLNAMLTRIEELMEALREVSDNIAHDLKTPLTRLRNRAEAALRDPDGGHREGLLRIIEEADGIIKTFNSLLLIARLEAGAVAESLSRVDPAAIVGDVAELYEPVAEEAGLHLQVSAEAGHTVLANRELVSQAVANLVDNAIKYSAKRAERPSVEIALRQAGEAIEIAVSDHGPGVAEEDRARALQRFVRLEKSRSAPGSGLGLSLVAAVARLHGGSVRLEDNRPGLRAVLSLPAVHGGDWAEREAEPAGTASARPAKAEAAGPESRIGR
jgi:signal transduction histidine kinase